MVTSTSAGNSGPAFTVAPLKEAALAAQIAAKLTDNRASLESEFRRPGDCQRLFGLKRGVIYALEREKRIRTVSLRRPGQIKGVKLIHVASVRAYLHGLMEKAAK